MKSLNMSLQSSIQSVENTTIQTASIATIAISALSSSSPQYVNSLLILMCFVSSPFHLLYKSIQVQFQVHSNPLTWITYVAYF